MSERGQCSQLLLACPRFVRGFFCPFAGEIQSPAGFWRGARGSFSPFLTKIAPNRFDCKTILMVFVSFKNYSHTVLERAQGPVQLARTKGQRVCPRRAWTRAAALGTARGHSQLTRAGTRCWQNGDPGLDPSPWVQTSSISLDCPCCW